MKANVNYPRGENNHASKLKDKDRAWIISMTEWKDDRINRIDDEIERLKLERDQLKKQYSQKQIAMDFGVKPITIQRVLKGDHR